MNDKEKTFISSVIYVHNAEQRIEIFINAVIKVMEENFDHSEIICVNDFSDDDSLQIIKKVSNEVRTTSISVVNMSYYHGLELAMNAGVDLSIGDFVFEFDNTVLDYDPEVIMRVYKHSLKGFDIVSASPNVKEKASSRLFYGMFNHFAMMPYKMETESFRILSRRVINRIGSANKSILYRKALYENCGLKADNIKYDRIKKVESLTFDKKEKRYRYRLAFDSLLVFTEVGYRFSITMTMVMMLISLFVLAYTIITYLTTNPVAGWTTTVLFLSICFFGLFGILTIVIKYLQLLVDMVLKRKHYSFESIDKLS